MHTVSKPQVQNNKTGVMWKSPKEAVQPRHVREETTARKPVGNISMPVPNNSSRNSNDIPARTYSANKSVSTGDEYLTNHKVTPNKILAGSRDAVNDPFHSPSKEMNLSSSKMNVSKGTSKGPSMNSKESVSAMPPKTGERKPDTSSGATKPPVRTSSGSSYSSSNRLAGNSYDSSNVQTGSAPKLNNATATTKSSIEGKPQASYASVDEYLTSNTKPVSHSKSNPSETSNRDTANISKATGHSGSAAPYSDSNSKISLAQNSKSGGAVASTSRVSQNLGSGNSSAGYTVTKNESNAGSPARFTDSPSSPRKANSVTNNQGSKSSAGSSSAKADSPSHRSANKNNTAVISQANNAATIDEYLMSKNKGKAAAKTKDSSYDGYSSTTTAANRAAKSEQKNKLVNAMDSTAKSVNGSSNSKSTVNGGISATKPSKIPPSSVSSKRASNTPVSTSTTATPSKNVVTGNTSNAVQKKSTNVTRSGTAANTASMNAGGTETTHHWSSTSSKKYEESSALPSRPTIPKDIALPARTSSKKEGEKLKDGSSRVSTLKDDSSKDSSSGMAQQTAEHYVKEQYGLSELPTEKDGLAPEEVEKRYAMALCFAIGAGDSYNEEQQEWIQGNLAAKGYSEVIVEAVPDMLKKSAELMDLELAAESHKLISGELRKDSAMLVYDMYRACAIEDFPEEQLCAIAMIADEIGDFKCGQLEEIKKQVELEEQVKLNRFKLLHPEGHPNLDEKYEDVLEDGSRKSCQDDSCQSTESRRSGQGGSLKTHGNSHSVQQKDTEKSQQLENRKSRGASNYLPEKSRKSSGTQQYWKGN